MVSRAPQRTIPVCSDTKNDLFRPRCARPPSPEGEGFWTAQRQGLPLQGKVAFGKSACVLPKDGRGRSLVIPGKTLCVTQVMTIKDTGTVFMYPFPCVPAPLSGG